MEHKKIKYRNYEGVLKELKAVSAGTYFLDMCLEDGGLLRLTIADPQNIKWLS